MANMRITLMESYMNETLRSKGITDESVLTQLEEKNIETWKSINSQYDYNELVTF